MNLQFEDVEMIEELKFVGNPADRIVCDERTPAPGFSRVLASGESAAHSGIYKLEHWSHDAEEEIFIREGTRLPFCHRCTGPLMFRLVRKLVYITEDPDFE